jgi:hypothetical protein
VFASFGPEGGGASGFELLVRRAAARVKDFQFRRVANGDRADNDCQGRAAVLIEPVSANSLRKTGIFGEVTGDFPGFPPLLRHSGSPETEANARKARISGPFRDLLGSLAEPRTAWLTWKDSNLNIPNREMPFEMSGNSALFLEIWG